MICSPEFDSRPILDKIKQPTLVVCGEEDALTVHHLQTGGKKKIKITDLLDGSIKIAG